MHWGSYFGCLYIRDAIMLVYIRASDFWKLPYGFQVWFRQHCLIKRSCKIWGLGHKRCGISCACLRQTMLIDRGVLGFRFRGVRIGGLGLGSNSLVVVRVGLYWLEGSGSGSSGLRPLLPLW